MRRFALVGCGITHSLSPMLFEAAYGKDSEMVYELYDTESFIDGFNLLKSGYFDGINITTPFKEEAYNLADKRDGISDFAKASNLLVRSGDEIHAYNTDFYGVRETLKPYFKDNRLKVLLIGAGAAARAALLALLDLGADITICNRTKEKAYELAAQTNCKCLDFDILLSSSNSQKSEIFNNYALIINTISSNLPNFDIEILKDKIVFEASYSTTSSWRANVDKNFNYIPGEAWLLNQAIPGFFLFTGIEPDVKQMELVIDNR
ncbi:MAG: hypothetical protein QMB39_04730 [Bacteroidales bacterium]